MKWLKSEFEKEFYMSDLKTFHYYFEMEFDKNRKARTIAMNQKSYIEKVLKHLNME